MDFDCWGLFFLLVLIYIVFLLQSSQILWAVAIGYVSLYTL